VITESDTVLPGPLKINQLQILLQTHLSISRLQLVFCY